MEKTENQIEKKYRGNYKKKNTNNKEKIKIIPIGGLDKIGMNITAIEYKDTIIAIDCGLSFPNEEMLGVDIVIPDVTYLKENIKKFKGFVITHGHEDHIGALPYILKQLDVPVYATKLTSALIEVKLKEHKSNYKGKLKIVKAGSVINFKDLKVEFINTTHSIADACALAIFTDIGTIVHSGDFKIDYTPISNEIIDLARFAELGKKGVLAFMCESTNVEKPGYTMSEATLKSTFDNIFSENKNNRILVATFASNIERVQQIINSAKKFKRKVVLEGRSMLNVINIAKELGYIDIPDKMLIDIDEVSNYPANKVVIVTTGSQGEAMAALSRMAFSVHKKITIQKGDLVIFSSHPIPGNERSIGKVINELYRLGAEVIFQDTHVSGHACQEEIKLLYTLLKPKFAIPVHGEYRHLKKHKELAESLGLKSENVKLLSIGDVLEISDKSAKVIDKIPIGEVYVDGLGVGDIGSQILRERQQLSENGLLCINIVLNRFTKELIAGPEIVSKGFIFMKTSDELIKKIRSLSKKILEKNLSKKKEINKLKLELKLGINDFLWKQTRRNPLIHISILEIE